MKHYRDPTPALVPPKQELPLSERIICGVITTLLVLGAVWVSTHLP
jgi:hypothetical protein